MKLWLTLAMAVTASASMATSFFDDFNRSNSANLGSNWTNVSGSIGIVGNQAQAPTQSTNLATVNGYADTANNTSISFDVFTGGASVQYVAAVLGMLDASNSIFVKVQDNSSSGNFNRAYFYIGNNGAGGSAGNVNLTPFTSAHIVVHAVGNTAYLDIDSDFNGSFEQSYNMTYGTLNLGTGAGLGAYGASHIDNYAINAVPEPASMAILGLGLVGLIRRKRS